MVVWDPKIIQKVPGMCHQWHQRAGKAMVWGPHLSGKNAWNLHPPDWRLGLGLKDWPGRVLLAETAHQNVAKREQRCRSWWFLGSWFLAWSILNTVGSFLLSNIIYAYTRFLLNVYWAILNWVLVNISAQCLGRIPTVKQSQFEGYRWKIQSKTSCFRTLWPLCRILVAVKMHHFGTLSSIPDW